VALMLSQCPSDQALEDFALGKSDEQAEEVICEHLEECDDCSSKLDRIESTADSLLARVRKPAEKVSANISANETVFDAGGKNELQSINCPHCRNPVDVPTHGPSGGTACPACGSQFRIDNNEDAPVARRSPTIGKFRLLEQVGRGGFGTVYRALDTELDRIVAVKIPRSGQFNGEEDQSRFEREARSAAHLHHSGIVTVYETGLSGSCPYIASEFVDGETLAAALRSQRFGAKQAAIAVAEVADALEYAHQQGVIHRDLKPGNIMLQRSADDPAHPGRIGRLRVMDFGLARRDIGEATLTMDGQILGTPSYMSPEQARGDAHSADKRADIYSLGVILYEMLSGETPFRGNIRMLLHQIEFEAPRSPRSLNDRIPRDLETVCLKCLEKDPDRRYQTAGELKTDLQLWLKGEPIGARPVSTPERLMRWCQRRPLVAGLFATVVLITMIGFASVFWQWREANAARELEAAARERAEAALQDRHAALAEASTARAFAEASLDKEQGLRQEADDQSLISQRHAYAASMTLAHRAWGRSDPETAWSQLASQRPRENQTDIRGFEWYSLWKLFQGSRHTMRGHTGTPLALAYSPDGNLLASAGEDNSIRLWSASTGELVRVIRKHQVRCIRSLAFSPDSKRLASAAATRHYDLREIKVWNVETGDEELNFDDDNAPYCLSVRFTPDGEHLLAALAYGKVAMWNLTSKELVRRFEADSWIEQIELSADGRILAGGGHLGGEITLWDFKTGEQRGQIAAHNHWIQGFAISPDGKIVAASSAIPGGEVQTNLWDTTTLQQIKDFQETSPAVNFKFSPDGKTLAGAISKNVKFWDVASLELIDTISGHEGEVFAIAFSPAGDQIATGARGGKVQVWDTPSPPPVVEGHSAAVNCVAWSPDDKSLASGGDDGDVLVWTVRNNQILARLEGHAAAVLTLAWAPDGKALVSAGADNFIRVWDPKQKRATIVLSAHSAPIHQVAFVANDQFLSASEDGSVKLWRLGERSPLREFEGLTSTRSLAVSPDKANFAIGDAEGRLKLCDLKSGTVEFSTHPHFRAINSIAFSNDGTLIATASQDRRALLFDAKTGEPVGTPAKTPDSLVHVSFLNANSSYLTIDSEEKIKIWSRDQRNPVDEISCQVGVRHAASHFGDDYQLALACSDRTVRIVEARKGEEKAMLGNRTDRWSLAFSPDGGRLAVGGYRSIDLINLPSEEKTDSVESLPGPVIDLNFGDHGLLGSAYGIGEYAVDVWLTDPLAKQYSLTKKFPSAATFWGIHSVRLSPTGSIVYAGSGGRYAHPPASWVTIWDMAANKQAELTLVTDYIRALELSNNGRYIAADVRENEHSFLWQVRVWDKESDHALVMETPLILGEIYDIAFSPSGDRFATAREDGKVRIWNLKTKALETVINAHASDVLCLAYSSQGLLATGGLDQTVKLWDLNTFRQVGEHQNFSAQVNDVRFSPDGNILAAVSGDHSGQGELHIWSAADKVSVAEYPWPVDLGVEFDSTSESLVIAAVLANASADLANLEPGDVIRKCDNEVINTVDEMQSIIQSKRAGDKISLAIERSGEPLTIEVILTESR